MAQLLRVAHSIDTMPLRLELQRAPHLWDSYRQRTEYAESPHRQVSDILVRFRARDSIGSWRDHNTEHRCVFWPAWSELPALRPIVFSMMSTARATELGSILITRLQPGGQVLPHSDRGGWAPEFFNTKFHLTVAGQSLSFCGGDSVEMKTGEVWTFDNLELHSVENPGLEERIVCIVSMRVEN